MWFALILFSFINIENIFTMQTVGRILVEINQYFQTVILIIKFPKVVKNQPARDRSPILGLGRFSGVGNGNLLQYILAQKPHGQRGQSMRSQRDGHD